MRNWKEAGVSGDFTLWIDDPSYSSKAPVPATGDHTPRVTVDGTTYTFESGYGIVLIKHLLGKPKDHPVIVCNLNDSVTVTVTPTS